MTTIDSRADAVTTVSGESAVGSFLAGVAAWLTTTDHKRIGRLFVGAGLLGTMATATVALVLGIDRIDGEDVLLDAGAIPQLFQAYRVGLVFATLVPVTLGLAIAVAPLQLGARSLAFPRLALAGFYGWAAGLVLVIVSLANNGGIGGGDADMVDLFLAAHGLLAIGLLAAAVALGTTVLTTRAPGMSMRRVPFFSWSALVTAIGLLLVLPVLVGDVIYLFVDHRHARALFGGNVGIGDWIGWSFTQPTTYVFAIPAVGVLAELVPVTFRVRQALRGVVYTGIALIGAAAFSGVTQQELHDLPWPGSGLNLDDAGDKFRDLLPYLFFNGLPVLGAFVTFVAAAVSVRAGRPRLLASMVFAFFGFGMIFVGMLGGLLYPVDDLGLQGTVFEEACLVYVAYGAVLGVLGGLTHWAPKLWGRRLPEGRVLPLALLGVLATVLAAFPYYIAGFADQPAGSVEWDYEGPGELWNTLVTVGHGLMAITVLAFVGLALRSFTGRGEPAGDDPWDGQTIEWATTSPAPYDNYDEVPVITSPEPLLDLKQASAGSPT
jgi:heme/copper-type cytochrome/quinol oxidase subunit 1